MDELPTTMIQHIYEYDGTCKHIFDKVLITLKVHCFILDVISVAVVIMVVTVIAKHVELPFAFANTFISTKLLCPRTIKIIS